MAFVVRGSLNFHKGFPSWIRQFLTVKLRVKLSGGVGGLSASLRIPWWDGLGCPLNFRGSLWITYVARSADCSEKNEAQKEESTTTRVVRYWSLFGKRLRGIPVAGIEKKTCMRQSFA